jgi:hypothetical protein
MSIPPQTASTLRNSQGRRLKFVVHLLLREFLRRKITHAFNRDGIILERQFERPGAVFVIGELHVGGHGPVANGHGVDITKIGRLHGTDNIVPVAQSERFCDKFRTAGAGRFLRGTSANSVFKALPTTQRSLFTYHVQGGWVGLTNELQKIGVRKQRVTVGLRPFGLVGFGVINGNVQIHVAEIDAFETFSDEQCI